MRTAVATTLSLALLGCSNPSSTSPPPARSTATAAMRALPITTTSAQARALFLEAERLRWDARPEEAEARYRRALAADPQLAPAMARIAGAAASPERELLIERARGRAAALPELERRWVAALIALATRRGDEIQPEVVAIAALAPDDWMVQMVAGQLTQFELGDHVAARRHLERAAQIDPTLAAPHNLLAYGYAEDGDLDRALASITRYAELAPGLPNPLDSKAEILLQRGQLAEAEAAFRAALAIDPGFRADDGLAVIQLHRGDLAGALTGYQRAWDRHRRPLMRWDLGHALLWVYLLNQRYDDALALAVTLEQVAEETGHYRPEVYGQLFRARIALHRGRWRDAATLLERAGAALDGDRDPRALMLARRLDLQRVRAYLGALDVVAAERVGSELTIAAPDDDDTRMAALLLAHHAGDLEATQAAAKLLGRHPQYGDEARLLVAELLAAAGEVGQATALRRQVESTFSRDPRSYILRQRAARALAAR